MIEAASLKREAELYTYARMHVNELMDYRQVQEDLSFTCNILLERTILDKYIMKSSGQSVISFLDFIMISEDHLDCLPDDKIIVLHAIHFMDYFERMYLVSPEYIPFYMLEKYGGFIPEYPEPIQNIVKNLIIPNFK